MYNINILYFNSKFVTVTYEGFWGVRDTAPPENGNKSASSKLLLLFNYCCLSVLKFSSHLCTKILKVRVCRTVFCKLFYT